MAYNTHHDNTSYIYIDSNHWKKKLSKITDGSWEQYNNADSKFGTEKHNRQKALAKSKIPEYKLRINLKKNEYHKMQSHIVNYVLKPLVEKGLINGYKSRVRITHSGNIEEGSDLYEKWDATTLKEGIYIEDEDKVEKERLSYHDRYESSGQFTVYVQDQLKVSNITRVIMRIQAGLRELGVSSQRALSSLKCDNPTQFSSACFSKIFSR
ncbi:MAG: hypothetical protein GY821_09610 [Gammaproteobacteria bacterium]|nr:hypothetical protein [Gammaproteobacteria bacterium]